MELESAILSSTAVMGVAAASGVALARSRYAWVAPGATCFLSLFPVVVLARLMLLAPAGSAARRQAMLGACYCSATSLALICSCGLLPPLPYVIFDCAATAAFAVRLYRYLAKRCPAEEK